MNNIPQNLTINASKSFIAFALSTRYIKQHIKRVPTLKRHNGYNYDVKEMIVHTKMWLYMLLCIRNSLP